MRHPSVRRSFRPNSQLSDLDHACWRWLTPVCLLKETRMRQLLCILVFAASAADSQKSLAQTAKEPFSITITAPQPSPKLSEPVLIHVELTNISQTKILLPEILHDGTHGEYNYHITVHALGGAEVPDTDHGRRMKNGGEVMTLGHTLIKNLDPGAHFGEDIDLKNVVKLTAPGDYTIQVERSL